MSGINITISKTLLPDSEMAKAKPLVGFDYGDSLYHIMLLPDAGGAIGIMREGDKFCARITLDSFAEFCEKARATHVQGKA
jgi:hypothetical protein